MGRVPHLWVHQGARGARKRWGSRNEGASAWDIAAWLRLETRQPGFSIPQRGHPRGVQG